MKNFLISLYVFFVCSIDTVFPMLPQRELDGDTGPCMVRVVSQTYKSNLPEVILKNSGYVHSNALYSSDGKYPLFSYSEKVTEKMAKEYILKKHICRLTQTSSTRTIIVHALHEHVPLVLQHVTENPNDINALILEGSILSDEYTLSSITDKFPSHIPIIMFHDHRDRMTPALDACALYAHLRSKNKNIYLIPAPNTFRESIDAICSRIFALHNLPQLRDVRNRVVSDEVLKKIQVQPDETTIKHLASILEREINDYYLGVAKKIAFGCFGILIFWKMVTFFTQ